MVGDHPVSVSNPSPHPPGHRGRGPPPTTRRDPTRCPTRRRALLACSSPRTTPSTRCSASRSSSAGPPRARRRQQPRRPSAPSATDPSTSCSWTSRCPGGRLQGDGAHPRPRRRPQPPPHRRPHRPRRRRQTPAASLSAWTTSSASPRLNTSAARSPLASVGSAAPPPPPTAPSTIPSSRARVAGRRAVSTPRRRLPGSTLMAGSLRGASRARGNGLTPRRRPQDDPARSHASAPPPRSRWPTGIDAAPSPATSPTSAPARRARPRRRPSNRAVAPRHRASARIAL